MTPEEQEISNCLDKVFAYCKSHKDNCEGCIFFKSIRVFDSILVTCKVMYAPEIFGESADDEQNLDTP